MMSCNGFASICFNQKTIPPHFHSCHPWLWLSRELKSNRKLCWSWPHLGKENESIMLEHFGWWAKDKKGKAGMLNTSVKAWKVYQLPASLLLYMRDVYVCALKAFEVEISLFLSLGWVESWAAQIDRNLQFSFKQWKGAICVTQRFWSPLAAKLKQLQNWYSVHPLIHAQFHIIQKLKQIPQSYPLLQSASPVSWPTNVFPNICAVSSSQMSKTPPQWGALFTKFHSFVTSLPVSALKQIPCVLCASRLIWNLSWSIQVANAEIMCHVHCQWTNTNFLYNHLTGPPQISLHD